MCICREYKLKMSWGNESISADAYVGWGRKLVSLTLSYIAYPSSHSLLLDSLYLLNADLSAVLQGLLDPSSSHLYAGGVCSGAPPQRIADHAQAAVLGYTLAHLLGKSRPHVS